MIFKKEFDIDKEFFMENKHISKKRNIALRVFMFVFVLTFSFLIYSAFNSSFKFDIKEDLTNKNSLKTAQTLYYNAIKNYEDGDYKKAIEELNKELQIVDDPDAYNYLGKIYKELNDTDSAIENYKKALSLNSDFFEPNFSLGKIYFELNNYKLASFYLTKALEIRDDNTELLMLLAETFKLTGKADNSIELYKKVLKYNDEKTIPNIKIGEIYYQRLQYSEAILYFKKALTENFNENAAIYLAKCYFELNDYKNASSILDEILIFNKENTQAKSLKRTIEYKLSLNENIKTEKIEGKNNEKPINKEALTNYIQEIETKIKANWTPPVGTNLKKASVKFSIDKDGNIISSSVYIPSGSVDFDNNALKAIKDSAPFPSLPEILNREVLDVIFTFDFNVN